MESFSRQEMFPNVFSLQVQFSNRARSHPDQQGDHQDQKEVRLPNRKLVEPPVQERHWPPLVLATQPGLQVLSSPHRLPQQFVGQLSRHLWFSWTQAVTIFRSRRKVHFRHRVQIRWLPFPPAYRRRGQSRVLTRISLRRRRQLGMKSWCRRNRT